MTDDKIIEIRKAVRAVDVTKPWSDTLAFAWAVIEEFKKEQNGEASSLPK